MIFTIKKLKKYESVGFKITHADGTDLFLIIFYFVFFSSNLFLNGNAKPIDTSQDHLFFQDQDRSGQDQDHFFKTKTTFLKTIKLLIQDHWRSQKF